MPLGSLAAITPSPKKTRGGFAPICPEFVIELRSPSDNLADLQAKMEMWIANGAEVAWLIDPLEKAVVIYRPGEQPEGPYAANLRPGHRPTPGLNWCWPGLGVRIYCADLDGGLMEPTSLLDDLQRVA